MITQIPQHSHNFNISSILKHQLQSSRYEHKVSSINMNLIESLQGDMLQDRLIVADEEKPFKLKPLEVTINKAEKTQMEISQLVSKRQIIQNELKKLQHQEYKLHINQSRYGLGQSKLTQSMVSSSSPDRNFRSQLTEEEKLKIKSVLKAQKKFIKQLKLKELEYYEEVQKDRLHKIEAEENIKKEKCQQRKVYWQRIRKDIAQRQQSRKKKFVEDQKRLQEVKKSKKIYQILEDSWNHQLAQDEQLIKQATQHMRQDHKFDLGKIVQHQNEYQRRARQKEQARQKSVEEFKDRMKLVLPKIPSSKFFVTLKEEERRKKEQQEERDRKRLELNQKMYDFSKKVKEDYKPKIDQTAKKLLQMSIQQEKIQKKQGLPLGQVYNLGNIYMRQFHHNVALLKASRKTIQKGQQSRQNTYKPVKKTNYLIELKQKRKTQGSTFSLKNEVSKIMKNTTYSAVEKVQRARLVAKRLEGKENLKSSALISSINEKINILKALNEEA